MSHTPGFVGRERELTALERAWEAATRGRGGVVLVEGEPGIGKTRLARELATRADADEVWARCWDGGGASAWWPFVQVARRLARRSRATSDPAAWQAVADRFAVFDALTELLRSEGAVAPLLVVLDDVHAADESSLLALRFTADALRDARVLVVATRRTVDAGTSDAAQAILADLARCVTVIPLRPLDAFEVGRLASAADPTLDPVAVRALVARSGGNPLFVDGLLRASPGGRLPDDVRGALIHRFATLAPAQLARIRLAALATGWIDVALLAGAAGCDRADALDTIDAACALGLLEAVEPDRYAFTHPLLREVAAASLSEAERVRAHAALGDVLAARGADAAQLSHHFHAARALDGGARAVRYASEAADRALAAAAWDEAVAELERLLSLVDGGDVGVLLRLGDALVAAGRPLEARARFDRARALARPRGDAETLAAAAIGDARTREFGALDEHLEHLEEALSVIGPARTASRARVLATLGAALATHPDLSRRDALTREAVDLARDLGDPDLLQDAIGARLLAVWVEPAREERLLLADELHALADASGVLDRRLEASRHRLNVWVELGRMADAEAEVRRYSVLAAQSRRPQLAFNALIRQGMIPGMRGRLREAEAVCDALVDAGRRAGDPQGELIPTARRALLRLDRGDVAGVAAVLPALASHADRLPNFPMYRAILVLGLLAVGDPGAEREWERCAAGGFSAVPAHWTGLPTVALWSSIAAELGDRARAADLLRLVAPRAASHVTIGASHSFGSGHRFAGLLHRTLGHLDLAVDAFERALAHDGSLDAPLWVAHDLVELARTLRLRDAAGDAERSVLLTRRGHDLARELGLARLLVDVPAPAGPNARLVRDGPGWLATFAGRSARVKHSRGMDHLVALLRRPHVDVPALELGGASPDVPPEASLEALDAGALAAYRARVRALEADIARAEGSGEGARVAGARAELAFVARELAGAVGLGGRARPLGSTVERARGSVTKAIRRAITDVSREHPELGRHLEVSVRTGATCRYAPERPVVWG